MSPILNLILVLSLTDFIFKYNGAFLISINVFISNGKYIFYFSFTMVFLFGIIEN